MTKPLNHYAYSTFSQFGEDGIIEKIVEILPPSEDYWCVEFGAWDGKFLSNTYELIANKNWNGVLIEGNTAKFPELKQTFCTNEKAILINAFVAFEGKNTLDNLLKKTAIPTEFDLLSIDIDGNDYHIWESIKTYQPKLVIIEFNPSIPADIEFVQEKNPEVNHGNSLLSLIKLGKTKGYELIATTYCNGFFIKKEYFELFKIEDNSIDKLWKITQSPRVFQLYDGTLVLSEEFKLIWHFKTICNEDIQVIPRFLRHFGDAGSSKNRIKKLILYIYFKLKAKNKTQKLARLLSKKTGRLTAKKSSYSRNS
jgi:hypothetical protein